MKVTDFFGLAAAWKIGPQEAKDKLREQDAKRDKKISGHLCDN